MDNRLDEALLYAKSGSRRLTSRHTIAMEARLLTLLMQAAKLGGMSDTTELLKDAAELFRDPSSQPRRTNLIAWKPACCRPGRTRFFPMPSTVDQKRSTGLRDMLETPSEATAMQNSDLPIEGTRVVYQVYASYYMGQLLETEVNSAEARNYFEKVIQLDPSSNFGEMAYLKLA